MSKPRILLYDIETSPLITYTWGLFDQNIGLNQIKQDWNLLSWSAKWLDEDTIYYADQRNAKDVHNDKAIVKKLWDLIDSADIVITQNGKSFDDKKINARFIMHGLPPVSPHKHIDTLRLARKNFGFTSNKLAYMTEKLCKKYRKSSHRKFPGFELWTQCLAGNLAAWKEMESYNKADVFSLEELYHKLAPWGTGVNFDVYNDRTLPTCNCGSASFIRRGYSFTANGKYQRLKCKACGAWSVSKNNLLTVEKRKSLRKKL